MPKILCHYFPNRHIQYKINTLLESKLLIVIPARYLSTNTIIWSIKVRKVLRSNALNFVNKSYTQSN